MFASRVGLPRVYWWLRQCCNGSVSAISQCLIRGRSSATFGEARNQGDHALTQQVRRNSTARRSCSLPPLSILLLSRIASASDGDATTPDFTTLSVNNRRVQCSWRSGASLHARPIRWASLVDWPTVPE